MVERRCGHVNGLLHDKPANVATEESSAQAEELREEGERHGAERTAEPSAKMSTNCLADDSERAGNRFEHQLDELPSRLVVCAGANARHKSAAVSAHRKEPTNACR